MGPPAPSQWWLQLFWLVILPMPIACIAWTVTHEEIFREPRDYCARRSEAARSVAARKCFYLVTCEYCFSHWVTLFFLVMTRFRLLLDDWRGYPIAFFALAWVANIYLSTFGRLRQEVKSELLEAKLREEVLEKGAPPSPEIALPTRPAPRSSSFRG